MLTLVVGAQYGGEGKGKVCAYLGRTLNFQASCRGGGVNSSHTVIVDGNHFRVRLLPTACLANRDPVAILGPGTLIHIPTLLQEIGTTGIDPERVIVDPRAGVVLDEHVAEQRKDARYSEIGSTLTGTGYASASRCRRQLKLARYFPELARFTRDTQALLVEIHRSGGEVLVEGHQGLGLSNYHGDYPFCSSRDSTAAALLSEIGAPPQWARRIVLVVKVFPTRNHGGHLPCEMTTKEADRCGIQEFGGGSWGVDDRRRRVAQLCLEDVARAIVINGATEIALTGIDYLDAGLRGLSKLEQLVDPVCGLVEAVEMLGCPVRFLSTGPETDSMIELTPELRLRTGLRDPVILDADRCAVSSNIQPLRSQS